MPTPVDLAGMRVLVMGLGRFGGGIGVTRWLVEQGADVTVTDLADETTLADSLRQLDGLPVSYRLGQHNERDLDGTQLLVVSPAVDKARSAFFQTAILSGIPWTSENNLFFERCRGQIIGVTGSVGKSTTTAMIGEVLRAHFSEQRDPPKVFVGGNIGRSLLQDLPQIGPRDIVVLELSSFQLEDLAAIRIGPHHAVLTNIRPNHLDRHGTMAAYVDAKMNIVRFLREPGSITFNADDEELARALGRVRPLSPDGGLWCPVSEHDSRAPVRLEGEAIVACRNMPGLTAGCAVAGSPGVYEPVIRTADLGVPGRHNVRNAMLAVGVGLLYGAGNDAMARALRAFRGLPHRLEFVAEVGGVRYYNDSKSTTPDSAIMAVEAFEAPVVLIAGGYDKGVSFDALGQAAARRCRAVVCVGNTRQAIADAVRRSAAACAPEVRLAEGFDEAVAVARRLAHPGDVVLLSPACASYDLFANYEERGERFRTIVRAHP